MKLEPRELDPQLRVRERCHQALDEALDMYERGFPFWIVQELGWTDGANKTEMRLVIKEWEAF